MMISTNHSTIIFSYMSMGNSYDNHLTRVTMGNWMMSTNHNSIGMVEWKIPLTSCYLTIFKLQRTYWGVLYYVLG